MCFGSLYRMLAVNSVSDFFFFLKVHELVKRVAVSDVKANEQVIQQLKDAMMEQEDTMEKQDAVISQKDEEIKSLTSGIVTCSLLRLVS